MTAEGFLDLFPDSHRADEKFVNAWYRWFQHRKELRKEITSEAAKMQAKKLSAVDSGTAAAMIDQSVTNGWQGLFDLKEKAGGHKETFVGSPYGTPEPLN